MALTLAKRPEVVRYGGSGFSGLRLPELLLVLGDRLHHVHPYAFELRSVRTRDQHVPPVANRPVAR